MDLIAGPARELANELFRQGRYANAWNSYNELMLMDTDNAALYLANRAQCELKLEQFGSAIKTCTDALAIDAKFVKCYYRRALAYSRILKYSEAVADFQKVLEMAPNVAEARTKLRAAQALARYTAFQRAIATEDAPSTLESINLDALDDEGPETKVADLESLDDITESGISSLVQHFKSSKRLSKKMVFDIILRAAELFKSEPSLVELEADGKDVKTITICGDTHGQFYDVVNIFEMNGWPSAEHSYLFNGDFVDRGSWSTEVALLLYVLKLKWPKNVWINRGNHETEAMNVAYGFSGECKAKYQTDKVFKAFSESFSLLPLAFIVNNDYFVVHGGLFSRPGVTLDDIRNIDRLATPQPGNEGLMMELLWSDPQDDDGLTPSRRGIAHMFGPDVTNEFLTLNNLKAVIRSHECCDDGYEVLHDGKLITVFSAPNYCDEAENKGAYINIGSDSELKYVQFDEVPHPNIPPMAYASGLMR